MPKRVDLQERRNAIASAAISVIDREGLEGARLRDVARLARMTTGAVTHYFDSKDAVVEAALEEIVRRTLWRLENGKHKCPAEIASFVGQVCEYLPLDPRGRQDWRVWLAFWGRAITDNRLRRIHSRYYEAFVAHVAGALRTLKPDASLQRSRAMADALIAALDGVGARSTLEPEQWPARRQRRVLTSVLTPLLHAFVERKDLDPV